MNVRDILRLPFGKHDFTDGTFYYKIEKLVSTYYEYDTYWIVTYNGDNKNSITIHLLDSDIYDEGSRESGIYFRKKPYFTTFLGGIMVSGGERDSYHMSKWELCPKSSYKEWITNTSKQTLSLPLTNR